MILLAQSRKMQYNSRIFFNQKEQLLPDAAKFLVKFTNLRATGEYTGWNIVMPPEGKLLLML